MRKSKTTKFILNINEGPYFYGEEEKSTLYGSLYNVYYDGIKNTPVKYSADNFMAIHGMHSKMTLSKFVKNATLDLTLMPERTETVDKIFDVFNKVNKIIQKEPIKNPKIGSIKESFIEALDNYNQIIDKLPKSVEISYIDEYNMLHGRKTVKNLSKISSTETEYRKEVVSIENKKINTNGRQRIKKYDS